MCDLCCLMHACFCMWQIKRGQEKPQKRINWVSFVLPLHMMSYTAESETSLLWTVKERHIKLGDESRESVISHLTEGRLVPVNLSGWPDASASPGSLCGVALPRSPSPLAPPLHPASPFLQSYPPASHWIFSHSLTLKALLTATARERQSEENVCAVRVMWVLSSRQRQSDGARQPMWIDNKKKNNACPLGGGRGVWRRGVGWGFKVQWPPLYGSTLVNNSVSWGYS